MITSFEVGAVLKIIDEASPAIRKVLAQLRELNSAIEKTKTGLSGLLSSLNGELDPAIAQTRELAASWRAVSTAANGAQRSMVRVARASAAAAMPRIPRGGGFGGFLGGGGRGGRGGRGGHGGGGNFGVTQFGAPIPGGHAHFRMGSNAAMVGAGALGYGIYEESLIEDMIFQMLFHSGQENTAGNRSRFRKIIQDAASSTGFSLHDIGGAAIQELRLMHGAPGGGIDILPEILKGAAIESRLKGSSLEESMTSLIGMAHMDQAYNPEEIKKLIPAFSFLSTVTSASQSQIERAAGYSMPILRSGLGVDPMQTLLAEVALQRAGVTNTKSGTWIREMMLRAMPGTTLQSKTAFEHHEEALRMAGLIDARNKPTFLNDKGVPDLIKMLTIAGENLAKLPITKRAGVERALFGAQGSGAVAILSDPVVMQQMQQLRNEMPGYNTRYKTFLSDYNQSSPLQAARKSWADLQNVLADIGSKTLPPVVGALKDLDDVLKRVKATMPGSSGSGGPSMWNTIGKRAVEGAGLGTLIGGVPSGGIGALPGAALGGLTGGAFGAGEAVWDHIFGGATKGTQKLGDAAADTGKQAETAAGGVNSLSAALSKLMSALSNAAGAAAKAGASPIMYVPSSPGGGITHHTSIQLDGKEIGKSSVHFIVDRATRPQEGSAYHDATMQYPATDHAYPI